MHKAKQAVMKRRNIFIRVATLFIPLICMLLLLSQTAFAQNTYVITDGETVVVHTTFVTDPIAILDEAGLELDEDDTYITQTTDGVSEITVRRGEDAPAETEATVQTLRTTETYATTIPYEIVYCSDASLPAGTQRVLTNGETGEMSCTANVEYLDGSEVSRTVLSQTVTRQPVNALIAVGTGEAATQEVQTSGQLQISNGMITLPTGEVLTYTDSMTVYATAYTCEGYMGITATGTVAREGAIAVDPVVIPYGTRMFIVSNDGQYVYGIATAEDTGDPGFICGDRVDLYFDTHSECVTFGYRDCTVYFLGETEIQREYWGY